MKDFVHIEFVACHIKQLDIVPQGLQVARHEHLVECGIVYSRYVLGNHRSTVVVVLLVENKYAL